MNTISQITIKEHKINKILLLNTTHNLVCSYGEECEVEIFSLEFEESKNKNKNKNNNKNKYISLQTILDPHYYSIEYILETKINSNNRNYLLICSDMIHVFYLYDNDTKSILLQSINEFNYRYINQVIELSNANLLSFSNEYKISSFKNLFIENDEYFDDKKYIKKNNKKEIYELDKDKINKNNEIILYLLELYPNKYAYCYKIDDGEFAFLNNNTEEENEDEEENENGDENENGEEEENEDNKNRNKNININSDNFIYIKFIDNEYFFISELPICKVNKDFFNMFQYNENIMVFINNTYLTLIDLNYFEIIAKIKTGKISFAYFFTNIILNNNYINYLILRTNNVEESLTSSSDNDDDNSNNDSNNVSNNDSNNDNAMNEDNENNSIDNNDGYNNISNESNNFIFEENNNIYFNDLSKLIYGIKQIKIFDNQNKEIDLKKYVNPDDIIDISITPDNKKKNHYYLSIFLKDSSILYFHFKI